MKKIFCIFATMLVAFGAFSMWNGKTEAQRNAFGKDDLKRVEDLSLEHLSSYLANVGFVNNGDIIVKGVTVDDLNMGHTRVQQVVNNVPVWEGEAIVHLKADGSLSTVTNDLKETISVNTEPNFSEKDAVRFALEMYRGKAKMTETPRSELYVYRGTDRDHLVYRIETPRIDGSDATSVPVIFIDAQTGEKVFEYNNLKTGTGSSLYSGTVSISTTVSGSTYYMEDTTRRMGTFNMNSTGNENTGTGGTQSRYTDTDDNWNTTIQRAGVDAHYGAAKTFDYYQSRHGRNGINGNYGPGTTTSAVGAIPLVVSRVHFGTSGAYNNAFWYNNQMSYGDGDGTTFSPLTTIDVAGHEMSHGVTEYTANLTYANESGALNEATSDIFGAMVEAYTDGAVSSNTWLIGEDCYTPGTAGDALRSMSNPFAYGDPDHYSIRYTGTADSGGVHTNSGIANHAFYLMAAGGTNRVSGISVTGIGASAMERIWYRALTTYMTASTNFSGARTATINAANDLFGAGSTQATAVAQGWCAVGVGSCPGGGTPTPTPTPGGGTELLVNGGFEGSVSPWVRSGTGSFYIANGSSPQAGTGYIYFGTANNRTGQAYQTVTIPSTATGTLTFWLNVTSAETTTTTQYDRLFVEVRNTSGTLLATPATYSNLNKTASSTTYSQKSLNLAAYKGQTVRVQFRATTDSSLITTFRVDSASLK